MSTLYDQIGKTYSGTRAADPRVTAQLLELLALPTGASLVDIGAGTGNYSYALAAAGYEITAVEPSATMRKQARQHERLRWFAGVAEALPFADATFAGAVMTLCMHHFSDWQLGLREAMRVIGDGPLAIFAFDVDFPRDFWLFDYFPELVTVDRNVTATIPALKKFVETELQANFDCIPFPLPRDLQDRFAASAWAQPELYLEKKFRDGISSFAKMDAAITEKGLNLLRKDLDEKLWQKKYGYLLAMDTLDRGYRFMKIQR